MELKLKKILNDLIVCIAVVLLYESIFFFLKKFGFYSGEYFKGYLIGLTIGYYVHLK